MIAIGRYKSIISKGGFYYELSVTDCPNCKAQHHTTHGCPSKEVSFFCQYCGYSTTYTKEEKKQAAVRGTNFIKRVFNFFRRGN